MVCGCDGHLLITSLVIGRSTLVWNGLETCSHKYSTNCSIIHLAPFLDPTLDPQYLYDHMLCPERGWKVTPWWFTVAVTITGGFCVP